MHDEGLAAGDLLVDQAGDVAVAAVLPQQGDRPPELEVGLVRPLEGGVGREQRPTLDAHRPRSARRASDAASTVSSDSTAIAEDGPQRGVDARQPGRHHCSGPAMAQAAGMARRTSAGEKL